MVRTGHHKALGGIEDNGGACPSTHNFYVGSTLGCAFREGFADYFAAAVYPSGIGGTLSSWLTDVESTPGVLRRRRIHHRRSLRGLLIIYRRIQ